MKNTYEKALFISLLISPVLFFCNRYTAPRSPESIEDRRTTRESRYDLMGFPGDREIVTTDVPAADDTLRGESDIVVIPEYVFDREESEEIFAVQVFASKSSQEASEFEQSVAPLFDEETTTDYKAPYYKVRIGNCANLEEAEALLEKVKDMGFRNAWLVRFRE
jgi:hypothetical protein